MNLTSFRRMPKHIHRVTGYGLAVMVPFLPAIPYAQATQTPVDITANSFEVLQNQGKAIFSGNVHAVQGNLTLEAPTVTVIYDNGGHGDIKELRAEGGATISRSTTPPEKAVGTTAVYTPASQQLELTGAVELTRGASTLAGDRLVYDIPSGNAKVTNSKGPVKARFTPGGK